MDNSYCCADERSLSLAMITIYLLDNSYCCADERWRSKCGSYILSCNKAYYPLKRGGFKPQFFDKKRKIEK
ncbi:MAG: hypothetical protein SWX82_30245 [Cyanobacteriota bacterium]|nr:hypothetical protein [Cyanobacteriota bacterium]